MLNKKGVSDYVMNMTFITRVRQQFYDHKDPPKNKNFQFAVFKFGPANDDWDPSIDDAGLEWSSSLVVQDFLQNTWQASSFAACKDGCHTEAVIINDQSISGLHHMFTHEYDQGPPHVFNIYSYNSPCITGPGIGCQNLIQDTLTNFFADHSRESCNRQEWQINIAWTLQFRDQSAGDCNVAWGTWAADLMEEHNNVTIKFGRQDVGQIERSLRSNAGTIGYHSSQYFLYIIILVSCILYFPWRSFWGSTFTENTNDLTCLYNEKILCHSSFI